MGSELSGKTVLVTGGSRGVGRGIAHRLLQEGARIVIAGRDTAAIAQAARELATATGGEVHGLIADTYDDRSVAALLEAAVAALGGLDIVVNAAARPGIVVNRAARPGRAPALLRADTIEQVNAKLAAYQRVARAAAHHMTGGGRIINIGGTVLRPTAVAPGSLRNAAVAALTASLADELGPKNVTVTAANPGTMPIALLVESVLHCATADGVAGRIVDAGHPATAANPKAINDDDATPRSTRPGVRHQG